MVSMFQEDFEAFIAEHERVYGLGSSPPLYPMPPQPKRRRRPRKPKPVQTAFEGIVIDNVAAETDKAACAQPVTVVEAESLADPSAPVVAMAAEAMTDHGDGQSDDAPVAADAGEGVGGGESVEKGPSSSLGFQTVRFQKGKTDPASPPSVLRMVQALHDPGEGNKKPPICYCGAPRRAEVDVHLREDGGRKKAGVTGIWRCRNGETCPHCAEAATARRRDAYARVGGATDEKGGTTITLVLSVSHSLEDRLSDLMRVVKKASLGARRGGTWARTIKPAMGCLGTLVDHHTRYGDRHGWHYHQHLTMFCVGKTDAEIKAAMALLIARYVRLIERQGYRAAAERQHFKILQEDPEGNPYTYPADHNPPADDEVMEIAAGDHDKEESLSPLMLAERAAHGDEQAAALYLEFSAAIKGTRSVVVTPALAKALEIETKVEEPIYTAETRLGSIPGAVWTALIDQNLNRMFLNRVESAGRAGWRAVRWWAMEQTSMAPAYSVELAHEVAALVQTWKRTDDPIVRELVNNQVGILKSDWAFSHGEELVEATLDYVAAHNRTMTVDEERVEWWLSVLEGNADKIARRRRDAASHTTLRVGDNQPTTDSISEGRHSPQTARAARAAAGSALMR